MDYQTNCANGAFAPITVRDLGLAKLLWKNQNMQIECEAVHVHCLDEKGVIDQYLAKGYVLQKRTKPTIIAQGGFVKLIFVRAESAEQLQNSTAYVG